MRCPYCRRDNDKVIDSRASQDGFAIRRRRICQNCKRRYTTFERLEEMEIRVVKKDLSRESFSREKIQRGLERACWKRPVGTSQIEDMVLHVENEVYSKFDAEVESRDIGEMVMQTLGEVDQVAFVRFASVYREFQDVRDFVDELTPMLRPKKQAAKPKTAPARRP